MAGSAAPKPAHAAIDVAFAAASQDGSPEGFALFEIALKMGADLDSCAGAFAACGAPELLAKSLALGANPRAEISLETESSREPAGLGGRALSLARRAFFSGCPQCAQIVADAGIDPLISALAPVAKGHNFSESEHDLFPFGTIISQTMGPGGGSWAAILAMLSKSKSNEKGASVAARDLLAPAILSIGAGGAETPLAVMRRLRELGACFEASESQRLAQDLWKEASAAIVRSSGSSPQRILAMRQTAAFAEEVDPGGMGSLFQAGLLAVGKRHGGWESRLHESPLGIAIKEQASAFASACSREDSAAKNIMIHGLTFDMDHRFTFDADHREAKELRRGEIPSSWIRCGAPLMDLCGKARDLAWLMKESAQGVWRRPLQEDLEALSQMAVACLCASAMLFAKEAEDGRGQKDGLSAEEAWLAEAMERETCAPMGRGAEFPLGCAKIAAASEPFLGSVILAVAPVAARLAKPSLSGSERKALWEAAKIAAMARPITATSPAMRL